MTDGNTFNEAKMQVRIRERIWRLIYAFKANRYDSPNILYMGYLDFSDLCRELEPGEQWTSIDPEYMGMKILRVATDRHLNVVRYAGEPA